MATSTVAFGLQLPVQSQSTLYAQPWEAAAGVPEVVAVARACDSAGFAYIAVCDHVAIPAPRTAAMGATWWDTEATLSYLAAADRKRVGSGKSGAVRVVIGASRILQTTIDGIGNECSTIKR